MKYVEFELSSGNKVTIFFNTNLTVQSYDGDRNEVYILDGLHNNGGWKVKASYDEAVSKIIRAMK